MTRLALLLAGFVAAYLLAVFQTKLPIIDSSCDCTKCQRQSSEFYDVPGGCLNCGQRFIVRSRKGDKTPLSVECPACECSASSWRRAS